MQHVPLSAFAAGGPTWRIKLHCNRSPKSVSSHAPTVLSRGAACRTFPVRYAMMGPCSAVHNWCTPSSASREGSPMTENTAQSVHNLGYHAHIYYDPTSTRAVAEGVCAALGEHFQVEIDAFRDTPIGPHPIANVLVLFKPDQFEHVVQGDRIVLTILALL